ncbi:MAG TPA: MFS transporter [Chloroflexia bacterium]|nr:MFS transporter [Chloroflexia bacterium]
MTVIEDNGKDGNGNQEVKRENWQLILYASFVAQLLSIMGFSASIPFIPLYLVKDLNIKTAAEAGLWAGVMAAASALTMAAFAPIWGTLADRYGRKSMVLRSMIGGCVIIALMAFTGNVWLLLILRIFQGALTGTVPANIALVASVTPKHRVGYALGIMQTAVFTGSSIGPLVGGALADLTDYRLTFIITSVALGVAALIVFFFVNEDFVPVLPDPNAPKLRITARIRLAFSEKLFVAMLIILSLVQFGNSVVAPVLALFIQALNGTAEGASTLAGLELGITGIASAVSAVVAGRLSDRYGHRKVLIISSLAAAILYFPQAGVSNVWELLILRGAMGLFFGGIVPSANALIAQIIPEGRKGAAYGLVSSITALGFALGPLTGAAVAAALNTRAVFILTGCVLLATAFWVNTVLATSREQVEVEVEAEVLTRDDKPQTIRLE